MSDTFSYGHCLTVPFFHSGTTPTVSATPAIAQLVKNLLCKGTGNREGLEGEGGRGGGGNGTRSCKRTSLQNIEKSEDVSLQNRECGASASCCRNRNTENVLLQIYKCKCVV